MVLLFYDTFVVYFLCHGYVIIVHSFFGGYLLMLTTRVICHFFGECFDPSWVHLKPFALIAPLLFSLLVVVHLFFDLQCPSLVLNSFGYMLILVVGTLFFCTTFYFLDTSLQSCLGEHCLPCGCKKLHKPLLL